MHGVDVYCLNELIDPEDIDLFRQRLHTFVNAGVYEGWHFEKGGNKFIILGVQSIQAAYEAAEDWFRHFGGTDFYDDVGAVYTAVRQGHQTWLMSYMILH